MKVDGTTQIYGIMGNPVAHSLSPAMHNAALAAMAYPAIYLAFRVNDAAAAMAAMRALNIRGLSVTIPHKVDIMAHLNEIDELAMKIGAVNTVVNQKGRLKGYNTDCTGAAAALQKHIEIKNKRVTLVGAGGAARAVAFGLVSRGAKITVFNRSADRGRALAEAIKADYAPLSDLAHHEGDIVINTTSVGMHPHTDVSPIPAHCLSANMVVMDIVYNPLETALLNIARSKGCKVIDGTAMFVLQGQEQLALWTGRRPPVEVMRQAVLNALGQAQTGGTS